MKGKIEVFSAVLMSKFCDYQDISDSFINFFLTLANKINLNIHTNNHSKTKDTNPLHIYHNYLIMH
jgi:hypothetical protein